VIEEKLAPANKEPKIKAAKSPIAQITKEDAAKAEVTKEKKPESASEKK
jgi:hypothetical protein